MQKISIKGKNKGLSTKTKVILIVFIVLVAAAGSFAFIFLKTYHVYETKTVKPTCESMGYTESVCIYCKDIKRTHYTSALGHDYGEIVTKTNPSELTFGKKTQTCSRCKVEKVIKTEPTIKMKKLYFTGDAFKINSTSTATGLMTYSYNGKSKDYYIKLSYLDSNRERSAKHDYKIEFFEDDKFNKETEIALMDGVEASHTWEAYGNYYDFYNLRDTVTTELFKEVRKTSKKPDERLGDNYITKKSEPVLIFLNETLAGVFRVFEPYSEKVLNVSEDDKNCAIVRAAYNNSQSYFRSEITDDSTWRIKYNSEEDTEWIFNSLNELFKFVDENDGEDFKAGISKYLDVDGMIDYMLTVYNTAAADNIGRCFTLGTYDGKVWTPGIFDVNASLGMNNRGEITTLEDVLVPSIENGKVISDTNSVLWDKMLKCFYDEIKARYNSLKDTVFTAENIYNKFKTHIDEVPEIVYEKEKELFPKVDSETDLKQSLTEFMAVRKNAFEVFFENETPELNDTKSKTN